MRRKLEIVGWIVLAVFFLFGVAGSFPLNAPFKFEGLAIWGGAFTIWMIVGWRSVKARRNAARDENSRATD